MAPKRKWGAAQRSPTTQRDCLRHNCSSIHKFTRPYDSQPPVLHSVQQTGHCYTFARRQIVCAQQHTRQNACGEWGMEGHTRNGASVISQLEMGELFFNLKPWCLSMYILNEATFCWKPCWRHICSAPESPSSVSSSKGKPDRFGERWLGYTCVGAWWSPLLFFLFAHNSLMMCSGICWGYASITTVFGIQFYNSIVVKCMGFEVTQIKVWNLALPPTAFGQFIQGLWALEFSPVN